MKVEGGGDGGYFHRTGHLPIQSSGTDSDIITWPDCYPNVQQAGNGKSDGPSEVKGSRKISDDYF